MSIRSAHVGRIGIDNPGPTNIYLIGKFFVWLHASEREGERERDRDLL